MPKERFTINQVMTIGAKPPASLVVPNGWIKNSNTNIVHDMPTVVAVLMSSFTILRLVHLGQTLLSFDEDKVLHSTLVSRRERIGPVSKCRLQLR